MVMRGSPEGGGRGGAQGGGGAGYDPEATEGFTRRWWTFFLRGITAHTEAGRGEGGASSDVSALCTARVLTVEEPQVGHDLRVRQLSCEGRCNAASQPVGL